MKQLETAIIKTLAYADLFNQALTKEELHKYLIGYKLTNSEELVRDAGDGRRKAGNLLYLPDREELAGLKPIQLQTTNYKLQTAQKSLWIFGLIPWIKMVGITGSVAGGTPTKDDDIDLLIITDKNRLWLSRLLLILALNLASKRRKPNAQPNQINNKFCLNMWLSTDNLSEKHHDLYIANELARIIPILNRHQTYEYYLHQNSWLQEFLPNFPITHNSPVTRHPSPVTSILRFLDNLAEKFQKRIMRHPTNETIQPNRLAFHPHDYRAEILKKYQKRLVELGVTS